MSLTNFLRSSTDWNSSLSLCVSSLRCNHGCMERYWSYKLLRSCRENSRQVLLTLSPLTPSLLTLSPLIPIPSLLTPLLLTLSPLTSSLLTLSLLIITAHTSLHTHHSHHHFSHCHSLHHCSYITPHIHHSHHHSSHCHSTPSLLTP